MRANELAFRFRVPIFLLLYLMGFLIPWNSLVGGSKGTMWLAASSLLARTGLLGLEAATVAVTLATLACLATGAALRVWGTAYLGSTIMQGAAMHSDAVVAAGPYRFMRNPLYVGSWLMALGTSVVMSTPGALFVLLTVTAFIGVLIRGEEHFLEASAGPRYQQYRQQVPRLLPRFGKQAAHSPARASWPQAFLAETYPVAFTLCFAVLAWRYNAFVLIRCMIVCYGASLVLRALFKPALVTSA